MDNLTNMSISEIRVLLKNYDLCKINDIFSVLKSDERKGVISLVKKYENILKKQNDLINKYEIMSKYENDLYNSGTKIIAGVDEVGRGPLAGPVVTCAVILHKDVKIIGVDDSKKLSELKRTELCEEIKNKALDYAIDIQDNFVIDKINILQATLLSMKNCIDKLNIKPDAILVDAVKIPNIHTKQLSLIKGDTLSVSIASASILAKVFRDNIMKKYHEKYPVYDFINNKGYGSETHINAIKKYGVCEIHREKYVRKFIT